MFVGLKSFGYSMLSKTLLRGGKRSELSASCALRLALMISRASMMESATSSLLCSRLDYWWLATPGAVAARNFLIFLISLVLVLLLLLMLVASGVRLA